MQQDVRPLLAACDAVALCSTAVETFSLAALEAMALGRPVVLSDIGGAAEMVRPGVEGLLFPAGDTAALVERLTALADESLRSPMGAAARETVLARFSESAMVDRYEALLQELVLTRKQRENLRRSAAAQEAATHLAGDRRRRLHRLEPRRKAARARPGGGRARQLLDRQARKRP